MFLPKFIPVTNPVKSVLICICVEVSSNILAVQSHRHMVTPSIVGHLNLDKRTAAAYQIRARRENSDVEIASAVSSIAIIGTGAEEPHPKHSQRDRQDEG